MTKAKDPMNDESVEQPADTATTQSAAEQDLTLTEFCQRLSHKDKRVEMIGAFHYSETTAGVIKDVESAFAGRYAAFINKPA